LTKRKAESGEELSDYGGKHVVKAEMPNKTMHGKTAACAGASTPAAMKKKLGKKKAKVEEFAELAEAEEVTKHKELDIARV
jgi:hypothetical protein